MQLLQKRVAPLFLSSTAALQVSISSWKRDADLSSGALAKQRKSGSQEPFDLARLLQGSNDGKETSNSRLESRTSPDSQYMHSLQTDAERLTSAAHGCVSLPTNLAGKCSPDDPTSVLLRHLIDAGQPACDHLSSDKNDNSTWTAALSYDGRAAQPGMHARLGSSVHDASSSSPSGSSDTFLIRAVHSHSSSWGGGASGPPPR